jgi:hypothetical protein
MDLESVHDSEAHLFVANRVAQEVALFFLEELAP